MIFTIPSGKHRARPLRLGFSFRKRTWKWEVNFIDAKYTPDPEDDTNKLCGVAFLPGHHKHSARFGWRIAGDKIGLYAYVYDNGERSILHLWDVPMNETIPLTLIHEYDSYWFCSGNDIIVVPKTHRRLFTYRLGLYFGGNAPAPRKMTVSITRI